MEFRSGSLALELTQLRKLFIQYLAIGIAFSLWGLVYVFLTLIIRWQHWLAFLLPFAGGFITSHYVWAALEKWHYKKPNGIVIELPSKASEATLKYLLFASRQTPSIWGQTQKIYRLTFEDNYTPQFAEILTTTQTAFTQYVLPRN